MAEVGHLKTLRCMLIFLSVLTCSKAATTEGGVYRQDKLFRRDSSPYMITKDIEVARGATLRIEPGVEVRFKPGLKLVVNGTLIAQVC